MPIQPQISLPPEFIEGQRLSAGRDMNPMREAIAALSGMQGVGFNFNVNNSGVNISLSDVQKAWHYAVPVAVRNVGDEQINPYEPAQVVGSPYITGTDIDAKETAINSGIVLDVRRPQGDDGYEGADQPGQFVIAANKMPPADAVNEVYYRGFGWHSGICPAYLVNTDGPGAPEYVDINPDGLGAVSPPPYPLDNSSTGSARVLYAPSTLSTTQKLCIIQLGRGEDSPFFSAKLTAETAGAYSWTEQEWSPSTNVWVDKTGGRTGVLNAYELNATTGIATGTIVWMRAEAEDDFVFKHSGGGGGAEPVWGKITGTSPPYSFVEYEFNFSTGGWAIKSGGITGDCREVNGLETVLTGMIVQVFEDPDESGKYVFDHNVLSIANCPSPSFDDLRHSGQNEDPYLDSWAWNGAKGCKVYVMTREPVYVPGGYEQIFGFLRELHISADGRREYLGPEVRYVVDVPVSCEVP